MELLFIPNDFVSENYVQILKFCNSLPPFSACLQFPNLTVQPGSHSRRHMPHFKSVKMFSKMCVSLAKKCVTKLDGEDPNDKRPFTHPCLEPDYCTKGRVQKNFFQKGGRGQPQYLLFFKVYLQ